METKPQPEESEGIEETRLPEISRNEGGSVDVMPKPKAGERVEEVKTSGAFRNESKAEERSSELERLEAGKMATNYENEEVVADRLGTEAEVFLNRSFGVELVLEHNSLLQKIREQVIVKREVRFVTCNWLRDTSRTHDELLAMSSELGDRDLSDTVDLLVMPIVHGPSVAHFEKPVRLRFFVGDLSDLRQEVMMEEGSEDISSDAIKQHLREKYEPLISADGENWRMLQPFDVVYKTNNDDVTDVWLETRLYHFSMGTIGKVLRKYSPDNEYHEGSMSWVMRIFKNPNSVIFGNATKDKLVYYACKQYEIVSHRRRNEGEVGAEGAHVGGAREDEVTMEHYGISKIMKYDINAGTFRTVNLFKDGKMVHDQIMFAVFLRENTNMVFMKKELLNKGRMYVVLPKMISDRDAVTEKRLQCTVGVSEVKKFLMEQL